MQIGKELPMVVSLLEYTQPLMLAQDGSKSSWKAINYEIFII